MNFGCFLRLMANKILFVNQNKKILSSLASLMDIFEVLKDLNLIWPGKNMNCINDYNAIDAFLEKLWLGIAKFKKKRQLPFLN